MDFSPFLLYCAAAVAGNSQPSFADSVLRHSFQTACDIFEQIAGSAILY